MKANNRYLRNAFLCLLLIASLLLSKNTPAQTYGLKFYGHDVTLDKRTELNLSPKGFLKFQDEIEISFDYKTTRIYPNSNDGFFGYVFRIVNKENKNIDLLSTPTPSIALNLVIGESNSIIPVAYPTNAVNKWIKLRVKFLLNEDKLIFYTPDTFYVHENIGFKKQESLKIIFGANDYKQFKNSDVPSMTIKDIEISEKGKLKYNWLLKEKDGNIAVDRIKGLEAQVINPQWLIQNHENWQPRLLDEIKGSTLVTADLEGGRIFMLGQNEITTYDAQKNNVSKQKYVNKPSFFDRNYRAIYNKAANKIYCYAIDNGPFYVLDLKTAEWNERGTNERFETRYRHHNSYYNTSDNCIYTFGGYGLHQYKNRIWKIDIDNKTWDELPTNGDVFEPKYLSGIDALNDTIYLLGGYGSQTGNQLINPHSYFDLIGYSIKEGKLFKKFEISHLIDDMVVGNSMWINEKNRDYYALIFSKIKFEGELQLIKGHLDSPKVEEVGDKIPFKFLDIRSTANLYYLPNQEKLYAFTAYTSDSTTQVAIYSIDNPPSKVQLDGEAKAMSDRFKLYVAIVLIFILLIVLLLVIRRKKVQSTTNDMNIEQDAAESVEGTGLIIEAVQELPKYHFIFFGGFQVFNKDFEDITNKFSPLLKELFLLILVHTYKNNKGISSDKITEVLWYDKSEKSARNNRAVNIAKLRGILEEVGSCELSKKTGYWKIELKDSKLKSDYLDFLNISSSKTNLTKPKINQLLNIVQKGAFLGNVYYDWLDEFKATVSDSVINTLVEFASTCDIKKEADFIIHLADSIFNFDIINEDALILKCRAQHNMGKYSHAKVTYEKFFKEYQAMYNQEYEKSFVNILEINK